MRYVLMPNDTPKDRISLRLLVSAGSLMEDNDQRGLAHFLEHMAFKGSENLPAGDLVQYLERLGMAFGADTNARTSFDSTVYQLELPSNDGQMISNSLKIMRETADRLLIPAAEVDKERGVILSEKRLRNSPEYRSFTTNLEFLLPKSLIPKREPIGDETVISAAPRERFVDFYRTWYRPQRVTLVAVGKLDPAEFAKQIEAQFASFNEQAPAKPNPDVGTIEPRGPSARLYSDPDAQTRVSLQNVTYADPGVDTQASQAKDVALYLANAVLSRRLTSLALQGNAGFTSGSAQSTDLLRFARISTVTLQTRPEEWKKALGVAEQELRRALTYGFTEAELEEQKTTLLSMYEQQAKSAVTRESPQLANEIVDHLTAFNVVTSPQYDVTQLERILPDITPARAQEVLGELWKDGPLIFVSGPLNVAQPEAEILQAFEASRGQKVAPQAAGERQKFAYTEFGKPTPVVEKKMAPALEVTQIRFGNNVRLNLKRTPFDANSLLVGLRFGGGRLDLPKDKAALKLLAEGDVRRGRTGKAQPGRAQPHQRRTPYRPELQRRRRCVRLHGPDHAAGSAAAAAGHGRVLDCTGLPRPSTRALPPKSGAAVSESHPHACGCAAIARRALSTRRRSALRVSGARGGGKTHARRSQGMAHWTAHAQLSGDQSGRRLRSGSGCASGRIHFRQPARARGGQASLYG